MGEEVDSIVLGNTLATADDKDQLAVAFCEKLVIMCGGIDATAAVAAATTAIRGRASPPKISHSSEQPYIPIYLNCVLVGSQSRGWCSFLSVESYRYKNSAL